MPYPTGQIRATASLSNTMGGVCIMAALQKGVPHIAVRWRGERQRFQVDFRWQGERLRPSTISGFPLVTEQIAQVLVSQIETEIRKGVFDPEKYKGGGAASLWLLREYAKLWLKDYEDRIKTEDVSEGYVRKLRGYMNLHVIPALGDMDIREITRLQVKQFYQGLSELSKKYRRNIMDALRKMFVDAKVDVPDFPDGYRKIPQHTPRWLTEAEQDTVWDHVPSTDRPIVLFGFRTGARWGEVRALQWDSVYLTQGIAMIRRTFDDVGKLKDTTKGKKDRPVALDSDVIAMLRSLPRALDCPFVFYRYHLRWKKNLPYSRSTLHSIIRRALNAEGFNNVRPHDANRHSFASQALLRGASTREVQAQLGHADIRTTEIYTHVLTEGLRRTVRSPDGHRKGKRIKNGND